MISVIYDEFMWLLITYYKLLKIQENFVNKLSRRSVCLMVSWSVWLFFKAYPEFIMYSVHQDLASDSGVTMNADTLTKKENSGPFNLQ